MLINGVDISNFNAKLLKRNIQTSEMIIYDDWLDNALGPLYFGKTEKFKKIEIKLLVQDKNDEKALTSISNLMKQLSKSTLKFNDLSYYYDCTISNNEHRRIIKGEYEVDAELKSGFAYKLEEIIVITGTTNIYVPGNKETPAIVEIAPTINLIDLNISGLGEDITIKNLTANKTITIDGEEGKITEEGQNKYKDYDSWGFPYLCPGKNLISIDKDNVEVKIKYKSRWI